MRGSASTGPSTGRSRLSLLPSAVPGIGDVGVGARPGGRLRPHRQLLRHLDPFVRCLAPFPPSVLSPALPASWHPPSCLPRRDALSLWWSRRQPGKASPGHAVRPQRSPPPSELGRRPRRATGGTGRRPWARSRTPPRPPATGPRSETSRSRPRKPSRSRRGYGP